VVPAATWVNADGKQKRLAVISGNQFAFACQFVSTSLTSSLTLIPEADFRGKGGEIKIPDAKLHTQLN
jgi:hypothetical protein